jgi:DNA-binding MarR family transcriptional regulator
MDEEGRRLGFHSTMHNHACAALTGMHPTDWEVLDVLCWKGTLSAGEIAYHLGLSNGAVTGAIDRLESTGWVRRHRDGDDRRRVMVEVLKDRDAEVEATFSTLNAAMNQANAKLSDDELDIVIRFMQGASVALEESTHKIRASARSRASDER